MRTMTIGGIEVTRILLGAGSRGDPAREREVFAVMDRYYESGGSGFDTARIYAGGASDEALGRWLRDRGARDGAVVIAKGCHPDRASMHASRLSAAEIEGDLNDSLKAIGTPYADFYLLHRDDPSLPVEAILPAMDALVKAGKTRAIGCSNWTAGRIAEANEFAAKNSLTPFAVCQTHFSLAATTAHRMGDPTQVPMSDVEFRWFEATRMPVMAFGTQARGYIAQVGRGGDHKPGNRKTYGYIEGNEGRARRANALAERLGVDVGAVAAAYVLSHRLNAAALIGFSSVAQLERTLPAERLELTGAQVRYLETGEGSEG